MAEISCKHCGSLDCRGCNIYRLEQMLDAGKLDQLMNENRVIQISADVAPVVHGRWVHGEYGPYCSNCDSYPPTRKRYGHPGETEFDYTKFCPSCGATMDADMREVDDG